MPLSPPPKGRELQPLAPQGPDQVEGASVDWTPWCQALASPWPLEREEATQRRAQDPGAPEKQAEASSDRKQSQDPEGQNS